MDESAAVRSSQSGDKAAFGSLVDRYYKMIYRFAYQFTGSYHDADDICQETFLKAFNSIKKLKDCNCFKRWIFMIALNLLRKHIKQTEYKKTLPAKLHDIASVEVVEDESAKPFETLFREEKAMIIHKQLQTMPELMRLVTILILMEGLTQKVAAGILTCSEATVSRQLDAARNWLRVRLQNLI
jgi:RNA polymerase sigma-70 factor (ECF subfamily)